MITGERTVLLADSDGVVRSLLAEYLRECGYHVLEAPSTEDVLAHFKLADRSIDVVLVDADLAGGGGFALLSWIRQDHPELPVLLVGTVNKAVEQAAELCDEEPPIAKPYDHRVLRDRIRRTIAMREGAERHP